MKITKATVKAALKRGVQMFVIADHNEMTEHQLCRDGRPVNRTEDAERILDTSRGFVVPEAVSTGGIKLSGACCEIGRASCRERVSSPV